jgi:hypothetical protein
MAGTALRAASATSFLRRCVKKWIGGHDEGGNVLSSDSFECRVDLLIRIRTQRNNRQIHCARRLLHIRELALGLGKARI